MSLVDRIILVVGICMIAVFAGYFVYGKYGNAEIRYHEGDCLKMDFPGVEAWHYGMIARVDTIGKQNYGVKYWLEYGWSTYTDTWPFSLSVVKVQCPQETRNDNQ